MDQDTEGGGSIRSIQAEGLTKRFGEVTAVEDVTFSVRAGESPGSWAATAQASP